MTILSSQSIIERVNQSHLIPTHLRIAPFEATSKQTLGMSYGLGPCGYDIRVGKIDRTQRDWDIAKSGYNTKPAESYMVKPGAFVLLSSYERFKIPPDVVGYVRDKSTLARRGLALQNTVLEPGWEGWITLELSNHGPYSVNIRVGQPIGQVMFELLDQPTDRPYEGKYQDAPNRPQEAIFIAVDPSDGGNTDQAVTPS